MYIAMMGADGLTEATKFAILNANYIAKRLENYFPTLYRGHGGWSRTSAFWICAGSRTSPPRTWPSG